MFTRMVRRVGLIAATGLVVFVFLLFAQVNMDDLRRKLGGLLQPNDPTLVVGGLYVVSPSGGVQLGQPAVCAPSQDLVTAHFLTNTRSISLRNSLGYLVPVISQLSAALAGAPLQSDGSTRVELVSGHTLMLDNVSNIQLISGAQIPRYAGRLFEEDADCEKKIRQYWKQGRCVAVVQRVSVLGDTLLGYTYNDLCVVPQIEDGQYDQGPLVAPPPHLSVTAQLSVFKDFIGLISYVLPVSQAHAQIRSSVDG